MLPRDAHEITGLKPDQMDAARNRLLQATSIGVLRQVVAALVPERVEDLWTSGPDVYAAARAWGQRSPLPRGN